MVSAGVQILSTVSPIDGRVVAERALAGEDEVASTLERARLAHTSWRRVPPAERAALCTRMVDAFVMRADEIAREITLQMGRPIAHSPGEVGGFEERARHMIEIAGEALADIDPGAGPGLRRFVRREPLGLVLSIAPWNYPYLTAVNSIVPALMAGNVSILRHSGQTPLCAERIAEAFREAGLPEGVFQVLHCDHASAERLVAGVGTTGGVDFVAFTGSVAAGHAIQRAAATRFIGVGLELGGKDPAYVREDADLEQAVAGLVDGPSSTPASRAAESSGSTCTRPSTGTSSSASQRR